MLHIDDNAVYTGCVRSCKSASYDVVLSVIVLHSLRITLLRRKSQTRLTMLQPYRCVFLYYVIVRRLPDIQFNDLHHDARTSATSHELGLRRVPASERLFHAGRQSNFSHRLHVSPVTLAHTSPNFPAPLTVGGTPKRSACVTLPTCCEVLDKRHKCLGQHDASF